MRLKQKQKILLCFCSQYDVSVLNELIYYGEDTSGNRIRYYLPWQEVAFQEKYRKIKRCGILNRTIRNV